MLSVAGEKPEERKPNSFIHELEDSSGKQTKKRTVRRLTFPACIPYA